jgi:hypothetical protein
MSPRRQLTLVLLTLASLVATACGTSPTAPRRDASIVVSGSSQIVVSGSSQSVAAASSQIVVSGSSQ